MYKQASEKLSVEYRGQETVVSVEKGALDIINRSKRVIFEHEYAIFVKFGQFYLHATTQTLDVHG